MVIGQQVSAFVPRDNAQLLRDFLEKSEAGAPGAPSVIEITRRHKQWSALRKQVEKGARVTVKFS